MPRGFQAIRPRPRGICSECKTEQPVTVGGKIRRHKKASAYRPGTGPYWITCQGSGKGPKV